MRTKEIKRQAATFRGKGHVACFSSQSLHAQLTDNGAAAESTKGQGAAELSEGESPSLRVMVDGQELAARTMAIGEVFSSRRLVIALVEPAEAIKGRALSGLAKQRLLHWWMDRRPQPRKSRRSTRARAART